MKFAVLAKCVVLAMWPSGRLLCIK